MNKTAQQVNAPKEQLHEQVWQFMRGGKLAEAQVSCRQLNNYYPRYAEGWHVASHLAMKLGMFDKGVGFIDRALVIAPKDPEFLMHKVRTLKALGQVSGAIDLARSLAGTQFSRVRHFNMLGDIFSELLLYPEAELAYQDALEHDPGNGQILFNLAATQRFTGKIAQAEQNCNRLIARKPDDFEVYLMRSELRKQSAEANHIPQLERLVRSGIKCWQDESKVYSALAKEYEDIGESQRAFACLNKSTAIRRAHMQYDVDPDLQTMEKIRSVYTRDRIDGCLPGHSSEEPIFILGLPRTGTTLVERILDSHSAVRSAGELNNFARQLTLLAMQHTGGRKLDRLQLVEVTAGLDFKALGMSYIESTRPYTGELPHFVDKLPLNFLYIGLIHLALPRATIVHLRRHPMDACYAIYKKLFRDAYPFSYDLSELARYYIAYDKLMRHWHQLFPGVIHDVHYEELVNHTSLEVQKLLVHCRLPWESQCLEFHDSSSVSTTASASQVRQKVYTSSVGMWRNYETELQPLKQMLEAGGIACD